MRYALAVILGIIVFAGLYSIASAARFDFVLGEPAVVEDGTVGDTFEQSREDFTLGEPSIVFDATATADEAANIKITSSGGVVINGSGGIILQ
jgi:hypothetical protein